MLDLDSVFTKAPEIKVAVLGDLMLDEWVIGSTSRISPEAPVPVVHFERRLTAPGGAANVAMNILSLGGRAAVGGVVGEDETGQELARELESAGLDVGAIIADPLRPTTLKTRIVVHQQQVVRVDREKDEPLVGEALSRSRESLSALLRGCHVICISDYDKGLAASNLIESAVEAGHAAGILVVGGPKPRNFDRFRGADFVSLNHKEASVASGLKLDSDEALEEAGNTLRERADTKALAITRGSKGVSLFEAGRSALHLSAHPVEIFDVAGAGDTFLSAATLALACKTNFVDATYFGNLAAAASVGHAGVVAVTPEDVRRMLAP